MNTKTIAVYFGCWGEAGHWLWKPRKTKLWDREATQMLIPSATILDGSCLFLPNPGRVGAGCITYLPAIDRTILAWWGNPWDKRPGVNSAFITNGDLGEIAAWRRFYRYFPGLASAIDRPTFNV